MEKWSIYCMDKNPFVRTTYVRLVYILYGNKVLSIQLMDNLSICCMVKNLLSIQYGQFVYMFYGQNVFSHTTYGKVVYICCI